MRLLLVAPIVIASLVQGARPAASDAVFDARQLQLAVRSIDSFKPKDDFSSPPDQSRMAGRAFLIEIPLLRNRSPGWLYNASEQSLTIYLMPSFNFRTSGLPDDFRKAAPSNGGHGWAFVDTVTSRSEYAASNAFGVAARVSSEAGRSYGLVKFGGRDADPDWETKIEMSPGDARAVTPRLRLRLQGKIHPVAGTRSVACYDDYTEPTLTNPRELLYRKCLVGARIEIATVIDSGTGRTLKEWRSPDLSSS